MKKVLISCRNCGKGVFDHKLTELDECSKALGLVYKDIPELLNHVSVYGYIASYGQVHTDAKIFTITTLDGTVINTTHPEMICLQQYLKSDKPEVQTKPEPIDA